MWPLVVIVSGVILHSGADLPLSTETAIPILVLGLIIVVVIAYDAYRQSTT